MTSTVTPVRSISPTFDARGLFGVRDAHSRQRELVRASLLLRPAESRSAQVRRH
jgi:hypothetical protein